MPFHSLLLQFILVLLHDFLPLNFFNTLRHFQSLFLPRFSSSIASIFHYFFSNLFAICFIDLFIACLVVFSSSFFLNVNLIYYFLVLFVTSGGNVVHYLETLNSITCRSDGLNASHLHKLFSKDLIFILLSNSHV